MSITAGSAETMEFGPLTITFDDRVLRPRPWTVAQSEWAAELLAGAPTGPLLELCAGAGQIGLLAIAGSERPLIAVDVDPVACDFARRNAAAAGLADRVEVRQGTVEDAVAPEERFPVIVADPPWVRHTDVAAYPEDPTLAIDGGPDGLVLAWRCVSVARHHLLPGGSMILQVGTVDQVDAIRHRLRDDVLAVTEVRWRERGVLARLERREA